MVKEFIIIHGIVNNVIRGETRDFVFGKGGGEIWSRADSFLETVTFVYIHNAYVNASVNIDKFSVASVTCICLAKFD